MKKDASKSIEKRLKKIYKKIKYSSKFRNVEKEYDDLLSLQEQYSQMYGIKKVIKNKDKLREKFKKRSVKYIEKRKLSCTPIDLKNDLIKKVYDQYDRGWCYAFAASDLISQHINKPVQECIICFV